MAGQKSRRKNSNQQAWDFDSLFGIESSNEDNEFDVSAATADQSTVDIGSAPAASVGAGTGLGTVADPVEAAGTTTAVEDAGALHDGPGTDGAEPDAETPTATVEMRSDVRPSDAAIGQQGTAGSADVPADSGGDGKGSQQDRQVDRLAAYEPLAADLDSVEWDTDGPVRGRSRILRGLAASRVLQRVVHERREPTAEERRVLAGWPGWGASPELFDEGNSTYADVRAVLKQVMTSREWNEAARTVINAHYTHPDLVKAIWGAVEATGIDPKRVLEPGSGSGNFIAAAPESATVTGVELDSTTARIAQLLYPHADIRAMSFADFTLDHDGFDATVGNVPFGKVGLYDQRFNSGRTLSIHNHFIVKSLALTKPGGVVAVISSRFTLDSLDKGPRLAMHDIADLIGVVRLPNGAHQETAGTDVCTDILVFRRRLPGEAPGDNSWLDAERISLREDVYMNAVFRKSHYAHVIGETRIGVGQFGPELRVEMPDLDVQNVARVAEHRLRSFIQEHRERGIVFSTEGQSLPFAEPIDPAVAGMVGHFTISDTGEVAIQGVQDKQVVKASTAVVKELRALIGIRDTTLKLLSLESSNSDESTVESERATLNRLYDSYVRAYGPINRFTQSESSKPDSDGDVTIRRSYPKAVRLFQSDPDFATVAALEHFDDETMAATKAQIFSRRVVAQMQWPERVDSIEDAIALSLDKYGEVNIQDMATTLGINPERVLELAKDRIYVDPEQRRWVTKEDLSSGNVRRKFKHAKRLLDERDELPALWPLRSIQEFYSQVESAATQLESVLPETVTAGEIAVLPNSPWIPPAIVEQWINDILGVQTVAERAGDKWRIRPTWATVAREAQFGTDDLRVYEILGKVLNFEKLEVRKEAPDGSKYIDLEATEDLATKATAIVEHFQDWLWSDPERTMQLQELYNDLFNGLRGRSYDDVKLSLPGLAAGWQPRKHQIAAVARILNEPSVGLFHEVGAGKTAEVVIATQELKRLGLAKKPLIIVPNHMLEQFSREYKQLYPNARVLVGGMERLGGSDAKARRIFVSQAAYGDWDAVVMTQNSFKRLGLSPQSQGAYLNAQIDNYRATLAELEQSKLGRNSVKQLQKKLLAMEEQLKAHMAMNHDSGIYFEDAGFDHISVDEAHMYKNLFTPSSINDFQITSVSQKAIDLDMKLWWLREVAGRKRVGVFATATPISNSMAETYVMLRYIRPDLLKEAGIYNADQFAAQFTEPVTRMDVDLRGQFKLVTKTGKFKNLPELLTMWHMAGDVKTAADLNLPGIPLVKMRPDGQRAPENVIVPMTEAQLKHTQDISDRIDRIRAGGVDPAEDNLLKISSFGRLVALDARLIDPNDIPHPDETTKVDAVVQRALQILREGEDQQFLDPQGNPHPRRGNVVLMFADRGTPSEDWNLYQEVRDKLVAAGMNAEQVRFIHEADDDKKKAKIFDDVRNGLVRVLIGSTEKMGVGTNAQTRVSAIMHIDCPWRPSDLVQRDGRGIRQGNQNAEVAILRFITEGSFDSFMYQKVTRKQESFDAIMSGKNTAREIEDTSEVSLSLAEAAALAVGDMRLIEQANLNAEITKLRRQERGFHRDVTVRQHNRRAVEQQLRAIDIELPKAKQMLEQTRDVSGDKFAAEIVRYGSEPQRFTSRTQLGQAIKEIISRGPVAHSMFEQGKKRQFPDVSIVLGGLTFTFSSERPLTGDRNDPQLYLGVENSPVELRQLSGRVSEWAHKPEQGIAISLQNVVQSVQDKVAQLEHRRPALEKDLAELEEQLNLDWPKVAELQSLEQRLAELNKELQQDAAGASEPPQAPEPPAPATQPQSTVRHAMIEITRAGVVARPLM